MNAGRELDALVAEKVMGLKVVRVVAIPHDRIPFRHIMIADTSSTSFPVLEKAVGMSVEAAGEDELPPPYSTDIAAAWLVVEKLCPGVNCQTGRCGECELMVSDLYYQVRFEGQEQWEGADTMPLAICLAALSALGVHVSSAK